MPVNGPRVAIVVLVDPEAALPFAFSANVHDVACELMAEGCAVSVSAWGGHVNQLLNDLQAQNDADRILLWDPDVTVDLPATKMALAGQRLVDALDESDVMTAPVLRNELALTVFSATETFRRPGGTEEPGSALAEPLRKRRPVVIGACGCYWLWFHITALSRLARPSKQWLIAGVDVSLSRRFIEGGAEVKCDPRVSVVSTWKEVGQWALEPENKTDPSTEYVKNIVAALQDMP